MNLKKSTTSAILALAITFGSALAPVKKANAGVIIAVTSSLVAMPVGLAVAGMFGGFGASVFSIYYAIANTDKARLMYGVFMLDGELDSSKLDVALAQKYPQLDSFVTSEIAHLITEKARNTQEDAYGLKEIILTEEELAPVLEIVALNNPEILEQLKSDLTKPSSLMK